MVSESFTGHKKVVESSALTGSVLQAASHAPWSATRPTARSSSSSRTASSGIFFSNMLGATPTITGSSPYVQTTNLGNPSGMSFTTQIGRPTSGGAMEPFTYNGCQEQSWEISCSQARSPA